MLIEMTVIGNDFESIYKLSNTCYIFNAECIAILNFLMKNCDIKDTTIFYRFLQRNQRY